MASRIIDIRILARLDVALHGAAFTIVEFTVGVVVPAALGILFLLRARGFWLLCSGIYLVLLGINYVPLLIEAIKLGIGGAFDGTPEGLHSSPGLAREYTRKSFVLLIPGIVPILWVYQSMSGNE